MMRVITYWSAASDDSICITGSHNALAIGVSCNILWRVDVGHEDDRAISTELLHDL